MNGVVNINKPKGMTSHDVVNRLRKIYETKKVGHTGTLDPLASGVLPICIGKATRISEYLMAENKTYTSTLAFGLSTNTLDAEGVVDGTYPLPSLTKPEILALLENFIGKQYQKPPLYSAIKIKGKRLYEYARNEEKIDVPQRKVYIQDIQLLDYSPQTITLEIKCSKGTYIRTLMTDIALAMNSGGHVTELIRTQSGNFLLEEATQLDELNNANRADYLLSLEESLKGFPSYHLSNEQNKLKLFHGNPFQDEHCTENEIEVVIYVDNKTVAIGNIEDGWVYPKKLLMPEVIFDARL